jgi:hypothetical protein
MHQTHVDDFAVDLHHREAAFRSTHRLVEGQHRRHHERHLDARSLVHDVGLQEEVILAKRNQVEGIVFCPDRLEEIAGGFLVSVGAALVVDDDLR